MSMAIKQLRLAKGWTQAELAERAGFDRIATISDLENDRGNPTLLTLQQIAAALDVTVPELFALDQVSGDIDDIVEAIRNLDRADQEMVRIVVGRLLKLSGR